MVTTERMTNSRIVVIEGGFRYCWSHITGALPFRAPVTAGC
ncbi:hypothetical protein [Tunturiibacter empetritectus]